MDKGADINWLDDKGNSALFFAAKSGHDACVTLLIRRGAKVNPSGTAVTPLVFACTRGNLGCVKILVENQASIDGWPEAKWTPLLAASERGHVEIAKYLIGIWLRYKSKG